MYTNDTIVASATGVGGAISVIRLSGARAIEICDEVFEAASGEGLSVQKGYTLHYGRVVNHNAEGEVIDDVLISLFRAPRSYTGEDMVEISCHGSTYIQQEIIKLLLDNGARSAQAGEFTIRAFLNGKMDLSQAEAVADMIASTDKAGHTLASQQMRGGYSSEFNVLREKLIGLVSLLELELDFSEEDVEFAERSQLIAVISEIEAKVESLLNSFSLGNSLKNGVAVAIVGNPNVGKSTLLNTLLKEERAMVSDIAGTTRDVIEESMNIGGVRFRFLDTAGIRDTSDTLERMGIERTFDTIEKARVVLLLADIGHELSVDFKDLEDSIRMLSLDAAHQKLCVVLNKIDTVGSEVLSDVVSALSSRIGLPVIAVSAKSGRGVDKLLAFLSDSVLSDPLYNGDIIVSNTRHYESLKQSLGSLRRAHTGITALLPADLVSQDIREALYHLGIITGEITNDDILGAVFSKFCIGK